MAGLVKPNTGACTALLLGIVAIILFPLAVSADTTIYYRRDARGVYHFTNRQTSSPAYKTLFVFRDIIRRSPGLGKTAMLEAAGRHSRRHGLDEALIHAVIDVESGFDPTAVSPAGAEGLMQIMPPTQRDLGLLDSFDPDQNIDAGVRYLRAMLDRFGTVELALAAYNAGPGNVEKYGGIPPFSETRNYVTKVIAAYKKLKGP